jgi:uncharacterized glyoxalase superfamily protein PhnB
MNDATADATVKSLAAGSRAAIPCLKYTDAHAAIKWLTDVLGAEARHVYDGPDNTVEHGELWFGNSCVMAGSFKNNGMPPYRAGEGAVYIVADSSETVDKIHAHAMTHGARVAIPLRDTDYGSRDFGVLDPEGNFWGFGTYMPE